MSGAMERMKPLSTKPVAYGSRRQVDAQAEEVASNFGRLASPPAKAESEDFSANVWRNLGRAAPAGPIDECIGERAARRLRLLEDLDPSLHGAHGRSSLFRNLTHAVALLPQSMDSDS